MKKTILPVSFFFGANQKTGYCSLFGDCYSPFEEGNHYILKGGPGTGKSTLMKKVAEKCERKGYFTERGYCSADPTSLDIVSVPAMGFSILDGTKPHTFDPVLPGVSEHIVNLGEAWNLTYLKEHRNEIAELTKTCSSFHAKAADYLWLASKIENDCSVLYGSVLDREKLFGYLERLMHRTVPEKKGSKKGKVQKRFLSGITPDGVVCQYDTVVALSEKIVTVEDSFSAVSPLMMKFIAEYATEAGCDVYLCFCPLLPFTKPEHLLIPELRLCFFTENRYHHSFDGERVVHASRFADKAELAGCKEKLRFAEKSKKEA